MKVHISKTCKYCGGTGQIDDKRVTSGKSMCWRCLGGGVESETVED